MNTRFTVTQSDFERWLSAYGSAWQGRDPEAAARLFSEDARYYWTPLDPPQCGPAGVAAAWQAAVSQQQDVKFTFEILAVAGDKGIASWRADFLRLPDRAPVRIEGVMTADFADAGHCRVFREWWHASTGKPG